MAIKTLDDVKYKIHKINVLNENDKKAKAILKKAAEQVQPIMRKRCWSVELLSEFLPVNSNLLGLNIVKNSEIKIRLRNKKNSEIFHFNDIIGTLLHELAHMVHSNHDNSFYKLLDKLILEYNELYISKNLRHTGKKIGDNKRKNICFSSNPKLMAAQAAEKRLINNFIDKDGKIKNLSLKSCLTKQQHENLFKDRKEHDDKICSLGNDIVIINPLNSFHEIKGNEKPIDSINIKNGNKIPTNFLNEKTNLNHENSQSNNKNCTNSKININYINAKSDELKSVNTKNNNENSIVSKGNNNNFTNFVNIKRSKKNIVAVPKNVKSISNNHDDDSVYILKMKKGDNYLKEIKDGNNSIFCDNSCINKNKKRKIIILD